MFIDKLLNNSGMKFCICIMVSNGENPQDENIIEFQKQNDFGYLLILTLSQKKEQNVCQWIAQDDMDSESVLWSKHELAALPPLSLTGKPHHF